jgi:oxygen-dependent protoporphyrinogen oxidase
MEQKFGILGGGISGLSTAFYLRKKFPKCSISLFEKEAKLGGWL